MAARRLSPPARHGTERRGVRQLPNGRGELRLLDGVGGETPEETEARFIDWMWGTCGIYIIVEWYQGGW